MKKAQHDRSVAEKFAAAGKAEVRAANRNPRILDSAARISSEMPSLKYS